MYVIVNFDHYQFLIQISDHFVAFLALGVALNDSWPQAYKAFFMLRSGETKIYPAHKC